jgi:alkane 1-monooxygenase
MNWATRKSWIDRKLALLTLSLGAYGHFGVEHNRGHHRHVATPEDPASSRMGETIYRFAFRELPGAFLPRLGSGVRAYGAAGKIRLESGQRNHAGLADHRAALRCVWSRFTVARWCRLWLLIAFWGMFQLTSANYIEHYGLVRKKLANGRYEQCQPHHSWNSNHIASNLVVFHLQRHSDHHSHPTRSYQSLRDFPELPTLPVGYFGMFMAAYLPPLWFRLMDKRLVAAVGGDASRINFEPAKRNRLMRRFGLAENAPAAAAKTAPAAEAA